ncbi:MAG: YbaN family protein [Betaproteobacteria bacterium]|nr:YbaN family protein [Betaproteobacteria bacterium]
MSAPSASPQPKHRLAASAAAVRGLWIAAGLAALATGIVGIFVPLLPTTPFVLLAAYCFSRGSARLENWLLAHPRFGPMVRDWRDRRAVPRNAKWLASGMMVIGCAFSATQLVGLWVWVPPLFCACVAAWLWRLPDR